MTQLAPFRRAAAGDLESFMQVAEQFLPELIGLAHLLGVPRERASGLANMTLIQAVDQAIQADPLSSPRPWLARLLIELVQAEAMPGLAAEDEPPAANGATGGLTVPRRPWPRLRRWSSAQQAWLATTAAQSSLQAALAALPLRLRLLVGLRDVLAWEITEISALLGGTTSDCRYGLGWARHCLLLELERSLPTVVPPPEHLV